MSVDVVAQHARSSSLEQDSAVLAALADCSRQSELSDVDIVSVTDGSQGSSSASEPEGVPRAPGRKRGLAQCPSMLQSSFSAAQRDTKIPRQVSFAAAATTSPRRFVAARRQEVATAASSPGGDAEQPRAVGSQLSDAHGAPLCTAAPVRPSLQPEAPVAPALRTELPAQHAAATPPSQSPAVLSPPSNRPRASNGRPVRDYEHCTLAEYTRLGEERRGHWWEDAPGPAKDRMARMLLELPANTPARIQALEMGWIVAQL